MTRRIRARALLLALTVVFACALPGTPGPAAAGPPPDPVTTTGTLMATPVSADGSTISSYRVRDARNITLTVHSAAMDRDVVVEVQRPADTSVPRPVLYLLNGAGGGQDTATWRRNTDATEFFADKNVNVVQIVGGGFTYYTDWRAPDPQLGTNMWRTFLTEELPPLIDGALGTNEIRAIAGMSMSGTSVLQLPIAAPGLYRAVAAYSGCARISDRIGQQFVKLVVAAGGGDVHNMYGPPDDPMWVANDPYVHAEGLRGLELYLFNGTGLPGPRDTPGDIRSLGPHDGGLIQQLVVGGIIEAATDWCTRSLVDRLRQLDIPVTADLPPRGTHSWGYWEDALKRSWPVLARGLELPES
ncbi:alpha/beta hydrolase family protein [Nocardia sp. CC201C]|uniref:alpha/beta hydrolase n=1 Tax=Nocardia sp. CC201C TaxID=3044575 RepID=UPI0024A8DBE0|nr:alpha/beta hydrolase family protein [Nocardia sp. CC201C]